MNFPLTDTSHFRLIVQARLTRIQRSTIFWVIPSILFLVLVMRNWSSADPTTTRPVSTDMRLRKSSRPSTLNIKQ